MVNVKHLNCGNIFSVLITLQKPKIHGISNMLLSANSQNTEMHVVSTLKRFFSGTFLHVNKTSFQYALTVNTNQSELLATFPNC